MTFSVVILSARASNLVPTVRAVLANEPELSPEQIVVVDDGARAAAEAALPGVRWVPGVKPFVFARNANLGIAAACGDVILLNDDARLLTPRGFSRLAAIARERPELGVCSAAVRGVVANPRQRPTARPRLRTEECMLAFVCVFIPHAVYERVGPLDERFVGYGFDDDDYCARVRATGLELCIWDGCVVDHTGALPSTYRTRPDIRALMRQNQGLFLAKQREVTMPALEPVDLFYPAWNRLEFTRETFGALLANTEWPLVRELVVYDDGSSDGTRE